MKSWKDIAIKNTDKPVEKKKKEVVVKEEKLILSSSNYYNECYDFDEYFNLYYGTQVSEILIDYEDYIKEEHLPIFNSSKSSFYDFIKKYSTEGINAKNIVNDFNEKLKRDNYRNYQDEDDNFNSNLPLTLNKINE